MTEKTPSPPPAFDSEAASNRLDMFFLVMFEMGRLRKSAANSYRRGTYDTVLQHRVPQQTGLRVDYFCELSTERSQAQVHSV